MVGSRHGREYFPAYRCRADLGKQRPTGKDYRLLSKPLALDEERADRVTVDVRRRWLVVGI
ncbi:MAG: hypothetical protein M3460_01720 [Actinomycetota bacterium]|nr:hypothetical protein [Actinomycetota bacterium]